MIALFPELVSCAEKKDYERLAILVRKYYAGSDFKKPAIDIRAIYEQIGIDLQRLPSKDYGSLIVKDEAGCFSVTAILSDKSRSSQEEDFQLAHMLGHFLLHAQPDLAKGNWHTGGFRESVCPLARYALALVDHSKVDAQETKEREADEFAAALIMPKAMVERALEKSLTSEAMAKVFKTSVQCVDRRVGEIRGTLAPVSFTDAEQRLTASSKPVPQEKAEKLHSQKSANDGLKMPKSFAASTYGRTDKSTHNPSNPLPASKAKPPAATPMDPKSSQEKAAKGLARLRQLAKKIDSSV